MLSTLGLTALGTALDSSPRDVTSPAGTHEPAEAEELGALVDRLEQLQARASSAQEVLLAAARAVAVGNPAGVSLDEPAAWLDQARGLLHEASAAIGSPCDRIPDAGERLAGRLQEIEAAAEQARLRAEQKLVEARRAAVDDFVRRLGELGITDPAEIVRAVSALSAPAELDPVRSGEPDVRNASPTPADESSGGTAAPDDGGAEKRTPAAPAPVPADAAATGTSEQPEPAAVPAVYNDDTASGIDGRPEPDTSGAGASTFADLIASGREDLAWLLAEATGQPAVRQAALRLFAAAMACDPARLEASLSAILPEEMAEVADDNRILLAACLRFGLSSGYSPLSLPPLLERAEVRHEPTRALLTSAVDAVQRGARRPMAGDGASYDDLLKQWAAIAERGRVLLQTLRTRIIAFHRATMVLRHLLRDQEPLGGALLGMIALSEAGPDGACGDPRLARLCELVEALGDVRGVTAYITAADKAVSSPTQLLKPIHSTSRKRLEQSIDEVRQLIAEGLLISTQIRQTGRSADLSELDQLRRAGAGYQVPAELQTAGEHALHRLALWIREDPAPVGVYSLDSLRHYALRRVFEIDRDADGTVIGELRPEHLLPVLGGRSVQEAAVGHLARGNVAAARQLLGEVDREQLDGLEAQCLRTAERLARAHLETVRKAEAAIAKLRSIGLDELARELDGRLDDLRSDPRDRYDLRRGPLTEVIEDAHRELADYREKLVLRLDKIGPSPRDLARIRALLDRGDEVTAEEFVTLLASGDELPPEEDARVADDFDEFFPAVVDWAAAASDAPGEQRELEALDAVLRNSERGEPTRGILRDGLNAWRALHQPQQQRRRNDGEFRRALADILRMLGLVPTSNNFLDQTDAPRTRVLVFEIRARPMDRSYVPQFGTHANGRYTVILMFERATPSRLLDLVSERRRTQANVVLYFGTLTVEQRMQLRQQSVGSPGKGSATLVIDEAVIGWLATREEPGFRLTQRVTLPFTAINPYTPFAGGDVPSEMFVGRDKERAEVESPTGSMFVYGGRQLGKSALLRRIERLFTEAPGPDGQRHRVALYLDLKSESIGEARSTDELWNALIRPLKELGVLPDGSQPNAGPDRVVRWIREWLHKDDANRLLLLLDEADMFLTADGKQGAPGVGQFRTLQRLKSLMESSERRFKPVFAGLHQVQRFHDSPNTPVAHGGADILIGPLRPAEVRKLVVDPMRAMGYAFESDELVWRIAALTNYQASLVQIFCEALIDHLRGRMAKTPGRRTIASDDIDGVYADRKVRELIAQRFRWTINLDARYRVIALVVALLSFGSEAEAVFNAEDLREYCGMSWPEAFSNEGLMLKEFMGYLDELVGLGILHRTGDRYGIRSPNVIALLGTKNSLDQELREAPQHFELPYEYNPRTSRIPLGTGPDLARQRSPLTDDDLTRLIGDRRTSAAGAAKPHRAGADYQLAVITGTPALGIDRVTHVLTTIAARQGVQLEPVALSDVRRRLADRERAHRHFVVEVDHRQEPLLTDRLAELVQLIDGRRIVRAIAVVRVSAAQTLDVPADEAVLNVALSRWSVEGLRSWHDFPFDTPALRRRVHRLTSGWPRLLERAAAQAATGKATEDVLDALATPFGNPAEALAFLDAVGLDAAAIATAQIWAATTSYPETSADLEAILGGLDGFLERAAALEVAWQEPNGWVLDPVVAAALALVT